MLGTIPAGEQRRVWANLDVDPATWPWPIRVTADPCDKIDEADESNNTTESSIPQEGEC